MRTSSLSVSAALGLLLVACGSDPAEPVDTDVSDDTGIGADADVAESDTESDTGTISTDTSTPDVSDVQDEEVDEEDIYEPSLPFCEGPTAVRYAPSESTEVELYPDDLLLVPQDESPTGRAFSLDRERARWAAAVRPLFRETVQMMGLLSGFGTNSGALIRFTDAITLPDLDAATSLTTDVIQFVDLSTTPPTRLPYTAWTGDEGRDLFVQPLIPMAPDTPHAVIVTRELLDVHGDCVAPAPLQQALIEGVSPGAHFDALSEAIPEAIAAMEVAPEDVTAVTVFTTHNDFAHVVAAHEHLSNATYEWESVDCTPRGDYRACQGIVRVGDYRSDRFIVDEPTDIWRLRVAIAIPDGDGPFPVVLYGHGLGGDRDQGFLVADQIAEDGYVVVAADALNHGDHPTANLTGDYPEVEYLGLDLATGTFDAFALSSNLLQTDLDRAQVLQTLRQHPDVDGDGTVDLDLDRVAYWGISLGAMLGPAIVALEDDLDAAVFTVGGGHLTSFVSSFPELEDYRDLIGTLAGSPEAFDRLIFIGQTACDMGDPAAWAPFVMTSRLDGGNVPDVLFPVAKVDEVVPEPTGWALARALAIPHLAPVSTPVDTLEVVEGPLVGNHLDGATAAYFQFDRVGGDNPRAASHTGVPLSPEGLLQVRHFLSSWLEGATEIIDPYPVIGTPPLDAEE